MTITQLTASARLVLEKRYLKKDLTGRIIETPEELVGRVARHIAEADARFGASAVEVAQTAAAFKAMMHNLWFLPNSPTLMNAGRRLGQLAACFVLPIEDSMEGIFETLKNMAMIHKSGGGTGFSFSRIRPAQDVVLSTAGISSGPLSFMQVYDMATETVKQGGVRRGANMALLRVDHPDIEPFITVKNDTGRLANFNLSVGLTDRFLQALADGQTYPLVNPRNGDTVGELPARHVMDLIIRAAWHSGEPGVVFIDRINAANPTPQLGALEATNPCGEQPLLPYESCTLGSINLSRMVTDGKLDTPRLEETVITAVHFLDNVIEVNRYPLPEIETMSRQTRKVGLGVMGFADLLIQMQTPYDSPAAEHLADTIMQQIAGAARAASADLARRRGNFPAFTGSVFDTPDTLPRRNATLTTIAPTGTLSLIAGTSSGIEPLFAIAHSRRVLDGARLVDLHPLFEQAARDHTLDFDELKPLITQSGSVQGLKAVPPELQRLFKTAHDISPEWHVRIQAAFQRHTDNAVSKTINFPASATLEDVAQAFELAARSGCKGLTVYRDGSRQHQVLTRGYGTPDLAKIHFATPDPRGTPDLAKIHFATPDPRGMPDLAKIHFATPDPRGMPDLAKIHFATPDPRGTPDLAKIHFATTPEPRCGITPRPRPERTQGVTERIRTGCGKLYVTVNSDSQGVCEVFAQMGKTGGCASSQIEAAGRLVSLALRSGVSPEAIIKQLIGIRCPSPAWQNGKQVLSCPDAMAQVLKQTTASTITATDGMMGVCPECSGNLTHQEGCLVCRECGFSRCS